MDPFIGEIRMFGGNFAPQGWAFCAGQLLSISENTALFNLLGTTYGGDGQTTFGLPDLRGRAPIHTNPTYPQGAMVGTEQVTLTQSNLPAHPHLAAALSGQGSNGKPDGAVWAGSTLSDNLYKDAPTSPTTMLASALSPAGGNQPHDNMQPYLVLNFIIALEGIYPSQN
jgi:microcystin-dependent protein